MPRFNYIQVGNGPVTLTCESCGRRFTVSARNVQAAADRHSCRSAKNAAANSAR